MPCLKKILLKLSCFSICLFTTVDVTSQPCSGSWALQRPLTSQCVVGQWVGWQNIGSPPGCPVNPIYTGVQINTFTFLEPVSIFSIDFRGFDGAALCARMEIRINGIFYPLTASNVTDFPPGSTCTSGSFSYVQVTPDGYLTVSSSGGSGLSGMGRITISNVNAMSVSVSTNDGSGTTFSDPFNCTTVPLKLESFTAKSNNCRALLNWKTGIEQNVRVIEIERSDDGIIFNKAGKTFPKGSNSQYSFTTDLFSDSYFRLKIIDLNGSYEYSRVLYLKSDCIKDIYVLTPNPANNYIEISNLNITDKVLVSDVLGKTIKIFNSPVNSQLDIQNLTPGLYIFQVINNEKPIAAFKVIKN